MVIAVKVWRSQVHPSKERVLRKPGFLRESWVFHGKFGRNSSICRCQRTNNVSELFGLGGNGSLLPEITEPGPATREEAKEKRLVTNGSSTIPEEPKEKRLVTNGSSTIREEPKEKVSVTNGSSTIREEPKEKVSVTNGSPLASAGFYKETTTEDEAWELLQAAVVYYCGSPVGTIAANDPTDPNILNYDQDMATVKHCYFVTLFKV